MSERITEIVEVLAHIRSGVPDPAPTPRDVAAARVKATRHVAAVRGIAEDTVRDKYSRQLAPDIFHVPAFERAVHAWLLGRDEGLRRAMEAHSVDDEDRKRIAALFGSDAIVVNLDNAPDLPGDDPDTDPELPRTEGRRVTRSHLIIERNRNVVRQAKAAWEAAGTLRCETCGFDFASAYGAIGAGFIEAHHRHPLSLQHGLVEVRTSDLVPLCANCHRMIHVCPDYSLDRLRSIIVASGGPATGWAWGKLSNSGG
ncbi:MAG: HNH endonuclease [Myxococcota bacterium]